jgi:hypothetical protein
MGAGLSLSPKELPPAVSPTENDTGKGGRHSAAATGKTPIRTVGFCVGCPTQFRRKSPAEAGKAMMVEVGHEFLDFSGQAQQAHI